ncbi:MAG: S9 family peptidase, partial [Bacteroidaceae bacterium]|nr:S9 family peptidase [Bacteroidaceae bacterium]
MKKTTLVALAALLTLPIMAQKRLFTINDLIPGGFTYYGSSVPENKQLTWWGDECIEQDIHECRIINKKDGSLQTLITLEQINNILLAAD